jgi:ketosteroid isomerase-like protein
VSGENIAVVQRFTDGFNKGEYLLDVLWAADAEVRPAPTFPEGGPMTGRDQIGRWLDGLREGWQPGSAVIMRELEEADDKVLASFEWHAIGEASGLETSSDWWAVYTIRGGQFVRIEFFADREAAIIAFGPK